MKRKYHTATAVAISFSKVVVVVFGGMDEYVTNIHQALLQPMKAATSVLEFGNKLSLIFKAHLQIELIYVFSAELQQSGSSEEEWILMRAADLASYRNLKAIEKDMRILNAEMTGQ